MGSLAMTSVRRRPVAQAMVEPLQQHPDMGLAARFFRAPCADPSHAIVEVSGCPFPPTINGNDLVCVDFTCRRLTIDSLYVIMLTDSPSPWIGIRRFRSTADGWLMSEDSSGYPPHLMTHAELMHMEVIGRVKEVFKAIGCVA